jgi:hypothetical protein
MASTLCSVFHVKQDQSDPFDTTVMALRQHYRVGQRRLNPIPTIGFIHRLVRKRNGVDVSGSSDEVCAGSARSRTSGCTANAYAPSVLSAASEVLSSAPTGTYALREAAPDAQRAL